MITKRELPRLIGFVARCSCSAVLAYTLAEALHLSYPIWALISAIVVSQEQLAETWTSTGRRIAGTILGACVAVGMNAVVSPFAGITVQVVLSVALCAAITHRHPIMRVSMWTCAIVLLTAKPPDSMLLTGIYRGSEVVLGGLIGGTLHQATEKLLGFLERIETRSETRERIESSAEE
jgi:uncharacterized membrane protein YgaE (UPF0421/DUF939 family)